MSKIIIFDFEVFKYDTLLGTLIVDENETIEIKQIWTVEKIKEFYYQHLNDLWIGHNNDYYDNGIMQAILKDNNPYIASKSIINTTNFRPKYSLNVLTYDLMCCRSYSLKMTEMLIGKKVHTTDVDFNLDRHLTNEEIELTNSYNKDDLLQTYYNFLELKGIMMLRLRLIKEFKIDKKFLTATEAKLATLALHAKQIPNLEYRHVKPQIYSTLQVKNKDAIDFYLSEGFRQNKKLTIMLCGVEHQMGSGGIHAALKKCYETDIIYLDVSGYYNLVMINYDLLPRTVPAEGKALYEYMYHEQLKLKGVDDAKRGVYKTILLSVFGASMNKYTDFYDPQVGSLITIVGQMFLVDLLEKLEGKVKLIQSNTDGIMVKPLATSNKDEVLQIVKDWCDRTGFVIKPKYIKELYQRDVNCYIYIDNHDNITHKGDVFIGNWSSEAPVMNEQYSDKEAAIIGIAATNFFAKHVPIEKTIEDNKNKLCLFQFICRSNTYKYCTYETIKDGNTIVQQVSNLNRAFAKKYDGSISMIYKHKDRNGKDSKVKVPNLPDNILVYNDEILSNKTVTSLQQFIDYNWYIKRSYERIKEFIPVIGDIKVYE